MRSKFGKFAIDACESTVQYKKVAKQHLAVMILYIKKTMARLQPGNYFGIKTKIL